MLGKGEDTRLYTFDEDYVDAVATNKGNLLQYNIGTLATPYQSAPTVIYNDALAGNLQQNLNSCIAPDAHGGWWISQYRAADAATIPSLIHVSTSGTVDFNSGLTPTLIENSYTGGMAVSYDGSRLAMGWNNELKIFDVTYSATGVPTLTRLHSIKPGLGANTGGVSFDRAGNVYAVSDSDKRLGIWALPKVENRFTTLAPSNQKINLVIDGLSEIKDVSNLVSVYPNPANDVLNIETKAVLLKSISIYDINGQLISNKTITENRAQVLLDDINPGLYIVKIGTAAGTVVKRIVKK